MSQKNTKKINKYDLTNILSSTVSNIDNNKKCFLIKKYIYASNQHITLISEGSCDTEDWSNDAKNSALPSEE